MHKFLFIVALGTIATGCSKKKNDGDAAGADKGGDKGGDTSSLPALTADPDPGTITAADKQPFESVKFRMLGKRNSNGWPAYDAYNLGTKPIVFMAIYGYAYDKDGKQVGRTKVPLSWNGKIDPGGKTDWEIKLGMDDDKVPASAASYAVCYNSIKFDGDDKMTSEDERCPEQMAKP